MADVYAFRQQQDVLDVLERNRRERAQQLADRGMRDPDFVPPRQRNYWVVPNGIIPARVSPSVPGIGMAYLLYLNRDLSQPALERYQWLGEDVEVEVSNYLETPLVEDESSESEGLLPIYRVSQDVFGELSILPFLTSALAQAPDGGIPARVNQTPGSASCFVVFRSPTDGTGYLAGDLVRTAATIEVFNWSFDLLGDLGDRIIQVSGHYDGADVVSADCENEADPDDIALWAAPEDP